MTFELDLQQPNAESDFESDLASLKTGVQKVNKKEVKPIKKIAAPHIDS